MNCINSADDKLPQSSFTSTVLKLWGHLIFVKMSVSQEGTGSFADMPLERSDSSRSHKLA
jgi:hypothetical protein